MNSEQAREQAERNFKKEERAQDGRKAMIEYEAQAVATRKKTARHRHEFAFGGKFQESLRRTH